MKYYDAQRRMILNEADLKNRGFRRPEEAKAFGILPLKEDVPSYDPDTEQLEITGLPEKTGEIYTLHYRSVPLDESLLKENLALVAKETLSKIRTLSDKTIEPYLTDYSETEKLTFDIQANEVSKYKEDPENAKTPVIDELAASRGVSRETLIEKAERKINLFYKVSSVVIGTQQKYEDMVKTILESSAPTKEKILSLRGMKIEYTIVAS